MIEAFPTLTYDGLTGTGITWDSTGAVSKTPKGMVIKKRRLRRHGVILTL